MTISSLDENPPEGIRQTQTISTETTESNTRLASSTLGIPDAGSRGHSRSSSQSEDHGASLQSSPPASSTSPQTSIRSVSTPPPIDKPLPAAPIDDLASTPKATPRQTQFPAVLKPHIASPNPDEFLLVIGTKHSEPGVGMFVSLDGEPTRATIQFERYPEQVVVDGYSADTEMSQSGVVEEEDSHVIASMSKLSDSGLRYGIEIQHVNAGQEISPQKHWLEAKNMSGSQPYGLRSLVGRGKVRLDEVVQKLSQKRFTPFPGPMEASTSSLKSSDSRTALSMERLSKEQELFEREDSQDDDPLPEGWESARNAEGEDFTRRLATTETKLAVWREDRIWWVVRSPLIIQLDCALDAASRAGQMIDRHAVFTVLQNVRGRDAKTELEYMTLDYLRQKAGLLLLISLLTSSENQQFPDRDLNALEEVLVDSKLDPRVVLSLVPGIRNDIVEGRRGIWIYSGVKKVAEAFLRSTSFENSVKEALAKLELGVMHFLRRFLSAWRKMKGFGSVADENEVFRTVDATLLIVLLELDQRTPRGLSKGGVVRSELNELVDKGVDCFERAVDILESYSRLFILSRLYQSRKMSGDVLVTWKRIIEGEKDSVPELQDGELRVRDYLRKVSSQALVQEYGVWLAKRNPRLGVQVFAEDDTRAPRFEPAQAVEILREEAPDAVKYYLEHLVFDKGLTKYVNELVSYYLDIVVEDLRTSAARQEAVVAAYDAYSALQAPKPTYHHFLTENAPPDDEVWQSRLRLLQLLGGPHAYDVAAIASRIKTLPGDLLVPETIILAGQEHRHEEALRLLVHRLGDYDTAVAYCLRGGSSVYARPSGRQRVDSMPEEKQQRQLFQVVLLEFLQIRDMSDRLEQTSALLERFGGWFDLEDVLRLVPNTWSVDVVAGFLTGALRRLVREKHESVVRKALSGAENLRLNHDLVVGLEKKGPSIEAPN